MRREVIPLEGERKVAVMYPTRVNSDLPSLILAHGAGSGMSSPFLQQISQYLHTLQIQVIRFEFPYRVAKKKMPDRAPTLLRAWQAVMEWFECKFPGRAFFVGGKSMGGRIAAMAALSNPRVLGVVFLGYPLHPAGRPEKVRQAPLLHLQKPMLFVQGDRDRLADPRLLRKTLQRLGSRAELLSILYGDHSFRVPARFGKNDAQILKEVALAVSAWMYKIWYGR